MGPQEATGRPPRALPRSSVIDAGIGNLSTKTGHMSAPRPASSRKTCWAAGPGPHGVAVDGLGGAGRRGGGAGEQSVVADSYLEVENAGVFASSPVFHFSAEMIIRNPVCEQIIGVRRRRFGARARHGEGWREMAKMAVFVRMRDADALRVHPRKNPAGSPGPLPCHLAQQPCKWASQPKLAEAGRHAGVPRRRS